MKFHLKWTIPWISLWKYSHKWSWLSNRSWCCCFLYFLQGEVCLHKTTLNQKVLWWSIVEFCLWATVQMTKTANMHLSSCGMGSTIGKIAACSSTSYLFKEKLCFFCRVHSITTKLDQRCFTERFKLYDYLIYVLVCCFIFEFLKPWIKFINQVLLIWPVTYYLQWWFKPINLHPVLN